MTAMNLQLKEGQTLIQESTGLELTQAIGGIRHLGYNVYQGVFSEPPTVKLSVDLIVKFYINKEVMREGLNDIYTITLRLEKLEDLAACGVVIDPEFGLIFKEKLVYDYILSLDGYAEKFEVIN